MEINYTISKEELLNFHMKHITAINKVTALKIFNNLSLHIIIPLTFIKLLYHFQVK